MRGSHLAESPAKPWRARSAEKILAGCNPGPAVFRRAAEAALADAKPSGDNQFKIELTKQILVRALTLAAAGTPARAPALPASPFSSEVRSIASTPDIRLTQAPAHLRHGSNIGQPLTRRDGVFKVRGRSPLRG